MWLGSPGTFGTLGIGHVIIAYGITHALISGRVHGFDLATPFFVSEEEYIDFRKFLATIVSIILTFVIAATYSERSLLVISQIIFGGILVVS